ncbi:1-(5-phosphoribosyl)-5-[(5-phosphoribosylamino)methylideneamino]imidazole-4-carboxamide isomerase [Thalassoroseus pseudoceratinae]|uniref:1-(5-phosphoribosyl)-5-[(5- phosphoribosylamino)methylideneamino]imidazole-4- carboxamide isomerase n=1 Tax=Thalassoroseus pseudoceratinae TaxID=2713176 RepID=UPI001420D806|nr:1-(5-phosphoribosyl)-5-[(5-phosphoribosylamino)methylideneamino]imidazole-4-carboxamide isomerase [Thalassoroseus pseudoceratinae]
MEIYPAIDIRGGKCVRLRQGDYNQETVFGEDPVAMARQWVDQGAASLHLVDLDGAREGQSVNGEIIRQIVQEAGVPCQLGGGLRDDAALEFALNDLGVSRAIVGTAAIKKPDWFREVTTKFPGRVALGLDARDSKVAVSGWTDVSEVTAFDLARRYSDLPLAAIIYTNIANDGMMQGIDAATIEDMIALTMLNVPIIASGGVTTVDDVKALAAASAKHPGLIGAIVGRSLYEGTLTVKDAVAVAG